jgi:hypothetical protein
MPTQMTKHVTVMILFTPVDIGLVLSGLPCQPLEKKKKNTLYQPGRQLLKHGATPRLTELDERASCDI